MHDIHFNKIKHFTALFLEKHKTGLTPKVDFGLTF